MLLVFVPQLSTIVLLFLVHTRVAAAMFESFVYGTAWGCGSFAAVRLTSRVSPPPHCRCLDEEIPVAGSPQLLLRADPSLHCRGELELSGV